MVLIVKIQSYLSMGVWKGFDLPHILHAVKYYMDPVCCSQGMDLIEKMDPAAFSDYLKQYQNTICGRHPISVLLNVSDI